MLLVLLYYLSVALWRMNQFGENPDAQPKSTLPLDSWIFYLAASNRFPGRGGVDQVNGLSAPPSSAAWRAFLGWGTEAQIEGVILVGEGLGLISSNEPLSVCFRLSFTCGLGSGFWYLCRSVYDNFLWEYMMVHVSWPSGGWLQYMRRELTGW